MRMFVDVPTVYLCADAVDFRKSINGLAALVALYRQPTRYAPHYFIEGADTELQAEVITI